MDSKHQRVFRRDIAALDSLFEFTESCAEAYGLDAALLYTVQLVLEELFTNLVKYDPGAAPDIPVLFDKSEGQLTVQLINTNGKNFDVSRPGKIDHDRPLQDRKIGGLGLYLVRNMVDDFRYDYTDGTGVVTIVLSLEDKRA